MVRPACTDPAKIQRRQSEPEPRSHGGIDCLAAQEAHPAAGTGEVGGHLEVDPEEAPVEDLQPAAEPQKEHGPSLDLDWQRDPPVERKGQDIARQPRADEGLLPGEAGSRGRDYPPELQVQAQAVPQDVAPDQVQRGLEALVDAKGAALAADGGMGVERCLERESDGPLRLGAAWDEEQAERAEPEEERVPHPARG